MIYSIEKYKDEDLHTTHRLTFTTNDERWEWLDFYFSKDKGALFCDSEPLWISQLFEHDDLWVGKSVEEIIPLVTTLWHLEIEENL